MSELCFSAAPPAEHLEAMAGNFEVLHAVSVHPEAGAALAKVRSAFGGKLPLLKLFLVLAPFAVALIKGEPIDWAKLIEAILSLIPADAAAVT